jgi:inhibitor of cysteine peptidase
MANSVLTEADANTVHALQRGSSVELLLRENPSTGYRWSIDCEPAEAAAVISSDWSPAGAGVGGTGTRKFVLLIREPGTLMIRAKLWRHWQGEGSVIERLEFTLQVR